MDDDDSLFFVGGLRCESPANWNVKIGVRQLRKSSQATVKMRVGVEDREQAVRRFVHEKKHTEAAALIDAVHGARPLSSRLHVFFCACLRKRESDFFRATGERSLCKRAMPPRVSVSLTVCTRNGTLTRGYTDSARNGTHTTVHTGHFIVATHVVHSQWCMRGLLHLWFTHDSSLFTNALV